MPPPQPSGRRQQHHIFLLDASRSRCGLRRSAERVLISPACVVAALLAIGCVGVAHAEEILIPAFTAPRSHMQVLRSLARILAERRGHNVTLISPHPPDARMPSGVIQLTNDELQREMKSVSRWVVEMTSDRNFLSRLLAFSKMMAMDKRCCEAALGDRSIQEALGRKYHLVVLEAFLNFCTWKLPRRVGAPFVFVSPSDASFHMLRLMGHAYLPSFHSDMSSSFASDTMTFWQRLRNALSSFLIHSLVNFYFLPLSKTSFTVPTGDGSYDDDLTLDKIVANASLLLSNQHFSLSFPKSLLPSVVEAGGLHIGEAKPLPREVEDFLQKSGGSGFLFFSLGSIFPTLFVKESLRRSLLEAFATLPFPVIMKWDERIDHVPRNILILPWAPQQDILAHPGILAFVSHGGCLSTEEALYHGVPMVVIPLFGDQPYNADLVVRRGMGVKLELGKLTSSGLTEAVMEVSSNSRYREAAGKTSRLFRDRVIGSKDAAVFWMEYAMRHRGTTSPNIASGKRQLGLFRFYLLDVLLATIAGVALVTAAVYCAVRACVRALRAWRLRSSGRQ